MNIWDAYGLAYCAVWLVGMIAVLFAIWTAP